MSSWLALLSELLFDPANKLLLEEHFKWILRGNYFPVGCEDRFDGRNRGREGVVVELIGENAIEVEIW